MRAITSSLAFLLLGFFLSSIAGHKFTVGSIPHGWTRNQLADSDSSLSFTFLLERNNLAILKELHNNVSDPNHPQWRQFLSAEEVVQLTQPLPDSFLEFDNWVNSFSQKDQLQVQKDTYSIQLSTTASVASALFQTSFYQYQHASGFSTTRIGGPAILPPTLESKVSSISGLTDLLLSTKHDGNRMSQKRQVQPTPLVTPSILAQAYGINYMASPVNSRSLQAIVGLNDSFSQASLNQFRTNYGLGPITITTPFGSNCIPNCDQAESDLDVQYISATGNGIPTIFVNSLSPTLSGLSSVFQYLDGLSSPPLVVSLSYGFPETQLYDGTTYNSIAASVETIFMSLGVKGVSIFVSSGDGGVSGDPTFSYTGSGCELSPSYPATSPYVTAVGATQLVGSNTQTSWQEISAQTLTGASIISGGGFSWVHQMPSWQTNAVNAWLQSGGDPNIPTTAYRSANRGLPDVSLVGHDYSVFIDSANGPVDAAFDGTSCSSPALAGMISLINNNLLNMGAKPIGPLNPLLYQLYATSGSSVFNQVASGANPCLPSRSFCCASGTLNAIGFTVKPTTWNPVIGLGTPKFTALMQGIVAAVAPSLSASPVTSSIVTSSPVATSSPATKISTTAPTSHVASSSRVASSQVASSSPVATSSPATKISTTAPTSSHMASSPQVASSQIAVSSTSVNASGVNPSANPSSITAKDRMSSATLSKLSLSLVMTLMFLLSLIQ